MSLTLEEQRRLDAIERGLIEESPDLDRMLSTGWALPWDVLAENPPVIQSPRADLVRAQKRSRLRLLETAALVLGVALVVAGASAHLGVLVVAGLITAVVAPLGPRAFLQLRGWYRQRRGLPPR